MKFCHTLNTPVIIDGLTQEPIPTLELNDQINNHNSIEDVFSENTPVYEKLINELYHSGFSDGREKGKEVQKKWQTLQQTIENNSKYSAFIKTFLAFFKEISPFQSLVDTLNSVEIPQIRNELSQKTPNFDEIQVLSVKTLILLDLIRFIIHSFKTTELPPQISKYKTEFADLIGSDQIARFLTPKLSHLDASIEEALNQISDLDALVKCWLKYYLIDRRAKLEINWAKENQPQISGFDERKLIELKSWGESLEENWIKETSLPDQYETFPQELISQIMSTFEETGNTIQSFITDISKKLEELNLEKESEYLKGENIKIFKQKLIDLETELGVFEPGDSLVNNNKQISYISGLPNLLTKLQNEIGLRYPERPLLEMVS